jgi:CheY-like chemotaxis protein
MENKNKRKKILVAEDDAFISEIYCAKFASLGHQVILAENGKIALEKISKEKPDVVLLDIVMPEMDGWKVLSELKKNPKLNNIPVLMLTNLGDKESAERAIKQGADSYLIKSYYTPEEVVEKIEELFKNKK